MWKTVKLQKEGFALKVVIAYDSQHRGNTKKLLSAVAKLADVTLINVADCQEADLKAYDLIGFASGTYAGRFSEKIIEFARNNLPSNKAVFLMTTYGLFKAGTRDLEKIIAEKSCLLLGFFGCRGHCTFGPFKLVGGIAKGHPDENDIMQAVEFLENMMKTVSP